MINYSSDEIAVIYLDSFDNLEYKHKKAIFDFVKSPKEILKDFSTVENYAEKNLNANISKTLKLGNNKDYIEYILNGLENKNTEVITLYSEKYPEDLKNTGFPPLALYCMGNRELLNARRKIGIVGSRKTLPFYLCKTEEIAHELTKNGITVVTGLAEGGDRAAINGSIESGNVISVQAGGLDNIYPESNINIFKKITKNGLAVSEHKNDVIPVKYLFPVRNRIIAGLSEGVFIVSGSRKSGARHTADYALEYGRDVYAFPYSPGTSSGELPNSLIKNGAKLIENADDVFDALMIERPEETEDIPLSAEQQAVYTAIRNGNDHIDKIIIETGMKIYEVMPILTALELKGIIVKEVGNTYGILK